MSQKAEIGRVLVWNVIWVEASVCSLGIRNDSLLLTCEDSVTMRRQMQKAARLNTVAPSPLADFLKIKAAHLQYFPMRSLIPRELYRPWGHILGLVALYI